MRDCSTRTINKEARLKHLREKKELIEKQIKELEDEE